MATPIHIFCGKGGVGKTLVSLSFGLLRAREGHRTLLITSHPLDELALSFSLSGLEEKEKEAASNLFIVHIDSKQVLESTVRKQMKSSVLIRTVLKSKIYESLVEIAPALKELAFLSRLRDLAETVTESGENLYSTFVWDTPATGHFLAIMKATQKFETYLTGPFAELGGELRRFFASADLRVFPITTLEEMAISETIELAEELDTQIRMPADAIICNMTSPLMGSSQEQVEALAEVTRTDDPGEEFLRFALSRFQVEQELFLRLSSRGETPVHTLPRISTWRDDLDLLSQVAVSLGESPPFRVA